MNAVPHARSLLPPLLGGALVLFISLSLHFEAFIGLIVLEMWLEKPPPPPRPPIEIEIVDVRATDPSEPPAQPVALPTIPDVPLPERPAIPEPPSATPRRAEPLPRPESPPTIPPIAAQPPPPPPPQQERLTSVDTRSQDPSVPPPDNAQYLAEENNRVEEETLARIRNPNLDDPEPEAASSEAALEAEEEGNDEEQEVAQLEDREGSDDRDPTPDELHPPEVRDPPPPSRSPTPSVSEAAEGSRATGGAPGQPEQTRQAAGGGRLAHGGGQVPTRLVVVHDPTGSFTIRVPVQQPEGEGEGDGGGQLVRGRGQGDRGEGSRRGSEGNGRQVASGRTARGRGAPDLRVSWTQFENVYGEETLRQEREAYLEHRRSRQRGRSHEQRWREFRAAIEHYDVRVRPGNQTALNTRADPFARYIAEMHQRIHQRFADDYLQHLPSTVDAVFRANPDMNTKLEVAIDGSGRVGHVSVVATSGDLLFDLGAFESVMGAQPFPVPPSAIQSPDGLVYMHWSFYRNHRQCGTFNAQAFILAEAPPPRRGPPGEPLIDRGPELPPGNEERAPGSVPGTIDF